MPFTPNPLEPSPGPAAKAQVQLAHYKTPINTLKHFLPTLNTPPHNFTSTVTLLQLSVAQRGGVKHISETIYEETWSVLNVGLENLIKDAVTCTEHGHPEAVKIATIVTEGPAAINLGHQANMVNTVTISLMV